MIDDKILFYKRQIFWLWTLVVTGIGLASYFLYFSILGEVKNGKIFWDAANDVLKNLSLELISTLLTIVIFVFFYEAYTQRSNRDMLQKEIAESFMLHETVLAKFNTIEKHNFLAQILKSLIGKERASMLYEYMLKRHLDNRVNYRDTEAYDVEILEMNSNFVLKKDIVISNSEHYVMNQNYLTTKRFPPSTTAIDFRVIFTFSEQSLDYWLNDNFVFMREIISSPETEFAIKTFDENELYKMVNEAFGLRLKFYDEKEKEISGNFEYLVKAIDIDKVTKAIEIKVNADKLKPALLLDKSSNSQYYCCKVSFRIPFLKSKRRFHYVLSEPTNAPRFSFKYDKSFQNIDFITYFTQSDDIFSIEKDDLACKYSFFTKKMVYPRSGVVFFWD
ncbi:MAG: hypothetical protein ACKVT2_14945 [Saprospiraceae bacterium]